MNREPLLRFRTRWIHAARAVLLFGITLSSGGCSVLCLITGCDDKKPRRVLLSESHIAFTALGETQQITATVSNKDGEDITSEVTITWSSQSVGVATVSGGRVAAITNGRASVTAEARGDGTTAAASATVTVDQLPASLSKEGDGQSGEVNATLTQDIVLSVHDSRDNAMPGVRVDFQPTEGGTVSPSITQTDGDGRARATWTLGRVATASGGSHSVLASLPDYSGNDQTFTATALPTAAVAIHEVRGDGQTWLVAEPTGAELVVQVVDEFGNGVPGHLVSFLPRNGGTATPPEMLSDAVGIAATQWFMGNADPSTSFPAARPDTLNAVSDGLANSPLQFLGEVHPTTIHDVSRGPPPETGIHYASGSFHSCPDSNVVIVTPSGYPPMRAEVISIQGTTDCANPRIVAGGSPDGSHLHFRMPYWGLQDYTPWSILVSVRGVEYEQPFGTHSQICPAVICRAPFANASAQPTSIPLGDNHRTVVTIDGSESSSAPEDPITFLWTVPASARFVNGTSSTDPVIEVTFAGVTPRTVRLEVTNRYATSAAEVVIGISPDR